MLKIFYFPICWLVQILVFLIISLQVIDNALDSEKMIDEYEGLTSDLLEWIEQTIVILNDRQFANSLTGVQQQLAAFSTYRICGKTSQVSSTPYSTNNKTSYFRMLKLTIRRNFRKLKP